MSKQEETRDRVLDLVESLEVGQPIPAERQLATDLGVSRLTLRAALDDLVRDGYLDRRHGSGTYVTEPKIAQPLTLTSFSEDMRRRGMVPGSRTLELTTTTAGARLAHRLGVSPETRLIRVKRLRLADSIPMAMEILHVAEALVPGMTRADLEGHSFYELLRERYGITIASGTQSIEPTVTSEEESEVLGVPLHTPAFLFERTTVSESGRIVEFVRSIYRGDRYRLVADLVPQRSRNGRSAGVLRGFSAPAQGREGDQPHGAPAPHSRKRGKSPV
ncbi:MAG TPA: GntR family transcriptional regulator [Candidatus Dormibacteraeota bacterium]|nr:GntR family transcriptional regulator [Candidatus Dormibacteraeota bacterium]